MDHQRAMILTLSGTVAVSFALLAAAALPACRATTGPAGSSDSTPGGDGITVRVSPDMISVEPNGSVDFIGTVTGTTTLTVTWSVREPLGGTIDAASGRYTAPASEGTFTVVATSTADPRQTGLATVVVSRSSSTDPGGLIPADRVTRWSPGIPGGVPRWTNLHTTIQADTYSVSGTNPGGAAQAINAALAAAAAVATPQSPQVVYLEAGTYQITSPIVFTHYRYVVLRGAGPQQTRLRGDFSQGSSPIIWFNGWPSGNWEHQQAVDVVGDVPRGATKITVKDASQIQSGDIIQIDQLDDPSYVYFYDSIYFKRGWKPDWMVAGPLSTDGYRSVNELLEVVAKSGNELTVSAGRRADGAPEPIGTHMAFNQKFHPQVFVKHTTREGEPRTSAWCGIEDMYLTGGTFNTIRLWNTSYSWVKNVELDGNPKTTGIPEPPGGYHTYYGNHPSIGANEAPASIEHCFRCEIRDSYLHHTQNIVQGGSSYGIVLRYGSANCLVENNIVVYFDKCITAATSGGGNVFGYNYVDNAYTSVREWQEGAIDLCHESFCHMDLAEGNWTAEMGAESTHGNTGWHTFFRNYAHGGNTGPTPEGTPAVMTGNTHAVQSTAWLREMTFAGNVLNQSIVLDGNAPVYQYDRNPTPAASIWRIGDNLWDGGTWDTTHGPTPPQNISSTGGPVVPEDDLLYVVVPTFATRAIDKLYRHGNWDSVTGDVVWDPDNSNRTLPDSLYLTRKPDFFGAQPWPWIDPTGASAADRVKTLPAKARFDAGTPNG